MPEAIRKNLNKRRASDQREKREEQPVIIRTFREHRLMEYTCNLESHLFDKTREVFNLEEQLKEKDQIILNLEQRILKLEKTEECLYSDLESDQREEREEQPVIIRTFSEQRLMECMRNLESRLFDKIREVFNLEEQLREKDQIILNLELRILKLEKPKNVYTVTLKGYSTCLKPFTRKLIKDDEQEHSGNKDYLNIHVTLKLDYLKEQDKLLI
ncbi:26098_t:CDS:2 [Gigaspora rosea]|nr:26098_t:CDS:2 [Gigaspora rosea]